MSKKTPAEMPFLDHLEELRVRLFWALGALVLCMLTAFAIVWQYDVIGLLAQPILPFLPSGKLVYTHPMDPMAIVLKVSFGLGLVAASPVIVYHVWAFLSPALHPHEKKVVVPVLMGSTLLFVAGVYLCVQFVLPAMFGVLLSFQSNTLEQMISAADYFGFAVTLCLAFGGSFQLPIVILALSALGLVNPRLLAKFRRHALVGSFLLGAIITPGDLIIVTLMLGVPLYGLYEVSIVLSWFVERSRKKRERLAQNSIGGETA
ncbi:MAG: twin-arginine translocase subunit TatC [Gemmatimonadaceae bacterium]|nr:twin-arginine translocase subunit TatC [Gemmatimonadaceae bacterium]